MLSLDLRNAFNLRHRQDLLNILFDKPEYNKLWRLAYFAYYQFSPLVIHKHGQLLDFILSELGVRQGDPLASFLFALSMQRIYQRLHEMPGVTVVAVQDDISLVGPWKRVQAAYTTFTNMLNGEIPGFRTGGIELNHAKSKLYWPHNSTPPKKLKDWFKSSFKTDGSPAPKINTDGLEILGSVIS